MIITFGTQKGGTGKTTLAIAFANYISGVSERKVNVFDFDFQKSFYHKWIEDEVGNTFGDQEGPSALRKSRKGAQSAPLSPKELELLLDYALEWVANWKLNHEKIQKSTNLKSTSSFMESNEYLHYSEMQVVSSILVYHKAMLLFIECKFYECTKLIISSFEDFQEMTRKKCLIMAKATMMTGEGAEEIARISEPQQVGNFQQGHARLRQILLGQFAAGVIEQLLKTGALLLQAALQSALR